MKAICDIGKRKRDIKENISEITRKRQRLMVATKRKTEKADDLAAKAESSSDFKLLKESNMIRKEIKEVTHDISVLTKLAALRKDLSEI